MKKKESLNIKFSLIAAIVALGALTWAYNVHNRTAMPHNVNFPETKYGAFLAAQHAVYVNDFANALKFADKFQDTDLHAVQNSKLLIEFLAGKMPQDAALLKSEKNMAAQLIYDAYLIQNDNWKELHNRHKTDKSALAAPLRIWSAIANDWRTNTFNFIESLPTNASWRAFIRGQIHAELGDAEKAAENFAQVDAEFMNINDYLYMMSFYTHHDMQENAQKLKADFTSRPGGMFMTNFDKIPDWSVYSGYKNALAFSLVQNVSHTQIMMKSDLAMLLLRFAQITAPDFANNNNAVDYYLGQYFFNNVGDYETHFKNINPESPFFVFGALRTADKTNNIKELENILDENPLFVPAVNNAVGYHIQHGNKRAALNIIKRAIKDENLNEEGRAFFIKSRAQINFAFGDLDAAQQDLTEAANVLNLDAEIASLQAKIWAAQNRELDNAYDYAMNLVLANPTDTLAWDTMGCVIAVRENVDEALDILTRVGEVSENYSALFEHIGDMYVLKGENDKAREAYMRAIDLSDDGLTVVPNVKRKIRKLK